MKLTCTILLALTLSVCFGQSPDCSKFVVFDRYSFKQDADVFHRFQEFILEDKSQDIGSVRDRSLRAGIPVPIGEAILKLDMDLKKSEIDWNVWKQLFVKSRFSEARIRTHFSGMAQNLSDNSKELAKACLQGSQFSVAFEVLPDGKQFKVIVHPGDGAEWIKAAEIETPGSVDKDCQVDNPFKMSWAEKWLWNRSIAGQNEEFSCGRPDPTKDVRVRVVTKNHGSRSIILPGTPPLRAVPPDPPPPPPQTVYLDTIDCPPLAGPDSPVQLRCRQDNVHGGLRRNEVYWPEGNTLKGFQMEGQSFARGLFTHVPGSGIGRVNYSINRKYSRFDATIGLSYAPDGGGVAGADFVVRASTRTGQKVELFRRRLGREAPLPVSLDISAYDELELAVSGTHWCGHATWADARLISR